VPVPGPNAIAGLASPYTSAVAERLGARRVTGLSLPIGCELPKRRWQSQTDHPITVRSKVCLPDGNNRTLGAMSASGLPNRAKRPKRCSHRKNQSGTHQFRNLRRPPTNRRENHVFLKPCQHRCVTTRGLNRRSTPRADDARHTEPANCGIRAWAREGVTVAQVAAAYGVAVDLIMRISVRAPSDSSTATPGRAPFPMVLITSPTGPARPGQSSTAIPRWPTGS